jgi:hypothetical protein
MAGSVGQGKYLHGWVSGILGLLRPAVRLPSVSGRPLASASGTETPRKAEVRRLTLAAQGLAS